MSVQPAYAAAPIGYGPVNFATANTNRDGTGAIAQVAVGRSPGTRIERVRIHAAGTTTAGMIRFYKKSTGLTRNADGTIASYSAPTWRLIYELAVAAITASGTVAAFDGEWAPTDGHMLADGEQLGVSTNNAETFNAEAWGGHL
jgi:hypothetical protein